MKMLETKGEVQLIDFSTSTRRFQGAKVNIDGPTILGPDLRGPTIELVHVIASIRGGEKQPQLQAIARASFIRNLRNRSKMDRG